MSHVAVIGGGPAGLMAADVVSAAGASAVIYEAMPSLGRKLLMAGRGGLNLTHSEPLEAFLARYGPARAVLEPVIRRFPPDALIAFARGLGEETFAGSSGRVFPRAMKASPLLRAWLRRLASRGVELRPRHRWLGFEEGRRPVFRTPAGDIVDRDVGAVVLALGGASWPRLGSDGGWVGPLAAGGVEVRPLVAANVGARIAWSDHFRDRFAGEPLKRIRVACRGSSTRGEAVVTAAGLEGGAVYALGPTIRAALATPAPVTLEVDLRPDMTEEQIAARLARPPGKQSMASWLRRELALAPVAIGLLREVHGPVLSPDPNRISRLVKALPLAVAGLGELERAISSAGGIALSALNPDLMLSSLPGIFAAGEMLDWDAPTGGYLLQAAFATGYAAGEGALRYLEAQVEARAPSAHAAGRRSQQP
jgi:hypothetical protein